MILPPGENLIRRPHSAPLWRLGAFRLHTFKRRLSLDKSRSAVSYTTSKILNSKSQLPHSRPRDPSRSTRLWHVRYWVRAFVRVCVGGWVSTCDHACVGARASERDRRSTSSNLKATRREARWARSCLPPHGAESARLSFRWPAWRVAVVVPMCSVPRRCPN